MPRVRLGVVLPVPSPVDGEVDGLRRALSDPVLDRVEPHLTLVPPVNVKVDEVPAAIDLLRSVAERTEPIELVLGPARAFPTDEGVVYLEIGGDLAALARLRTAVFIPPLERTLEHPFVPHVTITSGVPSERIPVVLDVLAGYREVGIVVDRLHLLQEQREPPHPWEPIAAVRLG